MAAAHAAAVNRHKPVMIMTTLAARIAARQAELLLQV
jgi:hypothetical protein